MSLFTDDQREEYKTDLMIVGAVTKEDVEYLSDKEIMDKMMSVFNLSLEDFSND